jgi:hypothetical protein
MQQSNKTFGNQDLLPRLPVNVNFSTVCDEHPKLLELSQIKRSAFLLYTSLRFKDLIDRGELEADRSRETPLCMMQFKKLSGMTAMGLFTSSSILTLG